MGKVVRKVPEVHKVDYGSQVISFTLIRSKRKTLAIHVSPDLSVQVRAPLRASLRSISRKVRQRGAWIIKKQHYFATFLPPVPPRQYVSGETHRYLGRQYRLKIEDGKPTKVALKGGRIHITTIGPTDNGQIKDLLHAWYLKRARDVFPERVAVCLEPLLRHGVKTPEVRLRTMITRWGSCSPKGRITLNTNLMRIPKRYIDYVVTHELCHLKKPNHGEEFYQLLTSVMPDWRERREKLNWYGSR